MPILSPFVEPQPQRPPNHQSLHDERGAEPRHGVLQGNEPHEVIPKLRVVPGAGIELAEQKPRPELPQVRPERVDYAAQQNGTPVSHFEVHALHDKDACPVDEQSPHAGDSWEFPVAVDHKFPRGRKHDLTEVAVDGVEVPAGQGRERDGRG